MPGGLALQNRYLSDTERPLCFGFIKGLTWLRESYQMNIDSEFG